MVELRQHTTDFHLGYYLFSLEKNCPLAHALVASRNALVLTPLAGLFS
jgi:hypothetical protein